MGMNAEIRKYLSEIGKKGGKAPSPHKKYQTPAERQKAYRLRKKQEKQNETQKVFQNAQGSKEGTKGIHAKNSNGPAT
jgi:hypothetical protein